MGKPQENSDLMDYEWDQLIDSREKIQKNPIEIMGKSMVSG